MSSWRAPFNFFWKQIVNFPYWCLTYVPTLNFVYNNLCTLICYGNVLMSYKVNLRPWLLYNFKYHNCNVRSRSSSIYIYVYPRQIYCIFGTSILLWEHHEKSMLYTYAVAIPISNLFLILFTLRIILTAVHEVSENARYKEDGGILNEVIETLGNLTEFFVFI